MQRRPIGAGQGLGPGSHGGVPAMKRVNGPTTLTDFCKTETEESVDHALSYFHSHLTIVISVTRRAGNDMSA